jgi:molybdenum cofactor biosynthesis enzyme MoaA
MGLRPAFRELIEAERERTGRIAFLVNDLVIEEQLCHLRCSYCLTEDFNLLMAVPDAHRRLTTDRRAQWHELLQRFHEEVDCPILRISGGEFFWLRASTEFVEECSQMYETVQIITNGILLNNERIERLAAHPNVQLNVSLDGHTPEMNRHRFRPGQARLVALILEQLDRAVAAGIPIEMQSVLTDANAGGQLEFCEFLRDRYGDRVTLYFFPVRGLSAERIGVDPGPVLDELAERYDELAAVLPPRAYVEHAARFMRDGRRSLPCFVTATMAQLFNTGNVSACPHAWIEPITNVLERPGSLGEQAAVHRHYDLFMQERPRFPFCRHCATPSDVINLYFLGEIDDHEISSCPLYSGSESLRRLRRLRELYAPVLARTTVAQG